MPLSIACGCDQTKPNVSQIGIVISKSTPIEQVESLGPNLEVDLSLFGDAKILHQAEVVSPLAGIPDIGDQRIHGPISKLLGIDNVGGIKERHNT